MSVSYAFNPVTGNLDLIGTTGASTSASWTPTRVPAGTAYTIPADSQVLYRRLIVLEAGASIVVGSNSVLQSVT